MTKKKDKRKIVLRIRDQKRAEAKAERAKAFADAKAFAEANPTPKLQKQLRIRSRNERQLLESEDTLQIPIKASTRLGIIVDQRVDQYQLNHWLKAITQQRAMREDRNKAFTQAWQSSIGAALNHAQPELELKTL
jgi:hypothetical protein